MFFIDANGPDNILGIDDDNLRLDSSDFCIDVGSSALVLAIALIDLDGNQRIVDDPSTTDFGVGFPDVVDMGAYEFGSSSPCENLPGDINCDGIVDFLDLALLSGNWLATI
jgi:hypothetical protein